MQTAYKTTIKTSMQIPTISRTHHVRSSDTWKIRSDGSGLGVGLGGLGLGGLAVQLGLDSGSSSLTGGLCSCTSGLLCVGDVLGSGLLGLGLMDVLNQGTLVLEGVTLGRSVQAVVKVRSDLSRVSVFS